MRQRGYCPSWGVGSDEHGCVKDVFFKNKNDISIFVDNLKSMKMIIKSRHGKLKSFVFLPQFKRQVVWSPCYWQCGPQSRQSCRHHSSSSSTSREPIRDPESLPESALYKILQVVSITFKFVKTSRDIKIRKVTESPNDPVSTPGATFCKPLSNKRRTIQNDLIWFGHKT